MTTNLRPDLSASRYEGLATGKTLMYSFDTQDAIPIDATAGMYRNLSPFTLRLVLPEIYQDRAVGLGVPAANVNAISRGGAEIQALNTYANGVQRQYGLVTITKPDAGTAPKGVPSVTQQLYAAGKALIQANGVNRRMAVLSDEDTARDIKYQVEKIRKAPPLTLLVNPNSMNTTYATVQKFSDNTRFGYLFERFGEEQVRITFSGSTGAFIAGENPRAAGTGLGESTTPTGAQFASRLNSAAYQNFVALYQFYRNNGYLYDTMGGTGANLAIGAVAIDYDQFTYIGHIESFGFGFKAETPHRMEWDMDFVVGRMYDRAGQVAYVGPVRTPYPNPLTGRAGGGATNGPAYANASSDVSNNTEYSQTPFQTLRGGSLNGAA